MCVSLLSVAEVGFLILAIRKEAYLALHSIGMKFTSGWHLVGVFLAALCRGGEHHLVRQNQSSVDLSYFSKKATSLIVEFPHRCSHRILTNYQRPDL